MKKPNINWFDLTAEWTYLFVIFSLLYIGIVAEEPFFKALSFTGVIAMTVTLINVMRKEK